MRLSAAPPDLTTVAQNIVAQNIARQSPERVLQLVSMAIPPDPGGKYHHWDKLRHLQPPATLSHEEWWFAIKTARRNLYRPLDHNDNANRPFVLAEPEVVRRLVREAENCFTQQLNHAEPFTQPGTYDSYLINSLIEEAITSSQLEGAATTRQVAKEMLRQNRTPRNRSERMIANNYAAMQFIGDIANDDLTPALVAELHRILTDGTLDNPADAGRLRQADDIYITDVRDGTVIHVPLRSNELPARLAKLCAFANAGHASAPLHPLVHAIVLHFLLAYDHPFVDGNGRTARALFYWSMLRQNYRIIEFISISRILKRAPAKYTRAYLYTETDNNDVTYFVVYQLQVIVQAITDVIEYLQRKTEERRRVEDLVGTSPHLARLLNQRQIALLNRALKKPDALFYIEVHRRSHNITYDTARLDLLKLVELGLFGKHKAGKAFVFTPVKGLLKKMGRIKT